MRDAHGATAAAGAVAADAATSDAGRAAISAFLLLESEFLQSLAGLVQGHAESVKGMAKDARAAAQAPAPADVATSEPATGAGAAQTPEPEPRSGTANPNRIPDPNEWSWRRPTIPGPRRWSPSGSTSPSRPPSAALGPGRGRARRATGSLRELFWGEE